MFEIFNAIHVSEGAAVISFASFVNSFHQRKVANRNLDLSIKKELLSLYKDFKLKNTDLIKTDTFGPQDIRDMISICESFISHINTKKYSGSVLKLRLLIGILNKITKNRILRKELDKDCKLAQSIYEKPLAHHYGLNDHPHINDAYSEYMDENDRFDYVNWKVFLDELHVSRDKADGDVLQQIDAYKLAYPLARKEIREILNITER